MLSFGICLLGLMLMFLAFLFWSDDRILSLVAMLVVLTLLYFMQPDMWRWYQFERDQKRLKTAQAILKDPHRVQELMESLKKHLQTKPNDAKAWFLLGRIHAGSGAWNEAHVALQKAYQLQANDLKTALFYVETLWHVEGNLNSEARTILLEILKKEPLQPDALMLLATEARQRHCPKEAMRYLQTLRALLSSDVNMIKSIDEVILDLKSADNSHCLDTSETSKH